MSSPFYAPIITALTTGTGKPAALGSSVYGDQLPQDKTLPAIRLAVVDDRPHNRLSNGDSNTMLMQVDIYANRGDSTTAWTVDAWVKSKLGRNAITVSGYADVQSMCVESSKPFMEPGYYRLTSRYKLFGSAS